MPLSNEEQYRIELLNRARLDPEGEAARYGIDLNKDLSAGTISSDAKQPLAPNELLNQVAQGHSQWMLSSNNFSHTGAGGSSPTARMKAAGYDLNNGSAWGTGENISARSISDAPSSEENTDTIEAHHKGLFTSEGHRTNIMGEDFREVGVSQESGQFSSASGAWTSSMLTRNFAYSGDKVYVTGVTYNDTDGDGFYTIGDRQR